MCVIIDASVAGVAFAIPYHVDFKPLWHWIECQDGRIVLGGRLSSELNRLPNVRRLLAEFTRAGLAVYVTKQKVDEEEKEVHKLGLCRSNDPHVIALARVSGARVLCTNDGDLEVDFKNRQLVSAPRGSIYKNASHKSLLKHNRICIGRPR